MSGRNLRAVVGAKVPTLRPDWRAQYRELVDRHRRPGVDPDEHQTQVALIQWADVKCREPGYGRLEGLFAIPNAGAGAQSGQSGKLRAEGLRGGMLDLCLPAAEGWMACYLELKVGTNIPSDTQAWWARFLWSRGYFVACAWGLEAAQLVLTEYVRGSAMRLCKPNGRGGLTPPGFVQDHLDAVPTRLEHCQ